MIKLLIVDDVFSVRDTMKDFLEFFVEEINIDQARNGAEAISKVEENSYDILISDQMMPDMKGSDFIAQTIEKLRADKTEIYIYSGQLMEDLSVDLSQYGEVKIIDKFTSPMFFKDILQNYKQKK
mgnify:CR=1 FL=1